MLPLRENQVYFKLDSGYEIGVGVSVVRRTDLLLFEYAYSNSTCTAVVLCTL